MCVSARSKVRFFYVTKHAFSSSSRCFQSRTCETVGRWHYYYYYYLSHDALLAAPSLTRPPRPRWDVLFLWVTTSHTCFWLNKIFIGNGDETYVLPFSITASLHLFYVSYSVLPRQCHRNEIKPIRAIDVLVANTSPRLDLMESRETRKNKIRSRWDMLHNTVLDVVRRNPSVAINITPNGNAMQIKRHENGPMDGRQQ